MRADDQEETNLAGFTPVIPPQLLRKRLGMTQGEFAKALRIRYPPCATGSRAGSCRTRLRDRFWLSWLKILRPH
jgi:hypothetical protein